MNFTKAIKSATIATAATIAAIAILGFYPKDRRNQEIERARKSVAERRAQIERQKAQIETELKQLKRELKVVKEAEAALTALHEPEPLPELVIIPNPWELESEPILADTETQLLPTPQVQLCLPLPQPEPTPPPAPVAPVAKKVKSKATPKHPKPALVAVTIPLANDYSKLSIRELKKLASGRIKNYGKLNKAQLVIALNAS